jgi:hypothetical protein
MSESRSRLADLHVGEIRFYVGGLDETSAAVLADLVARGLIGAATTRSATPVNVDRMRVEVVAGARDDTPSLAARIVDQVRAELNRLGEGGGPAA